MSEQKFKSMREHFEENYEAVQVPASNKRGFKISYQYVGKWYAWRESPGEVAKVKRYITTTLIVSIVLYLAAAIENASVNWSRWVSMLGLLSLAPLIFLIIGTVQFLLSKDKMKEESLKDFLAKLKIAPVFHGGLLAACGIVSLYTVFHNQLESGQSWIGICYLLAGVESLSILWAIGRLHGYLTEE